MQRIGNLSQSIAESGGSAVDGNRLYSILLDARASKASESMFDVAENLLMNEKDNSRLALERLWALRKDMQQTSDTGTVDLLIAYYQEKLDILREKEETIRKVSRDSRTLLEEKRTRDGELANVKQETADCSAEIERLNTKLDKLKVKEQELVLIEMQVTKELQFNANEIVNGLYEIILSQQAISGRNSGADESSSEQIPKENAQDNCQENVLPSETSQEPVSVQPKDVLELQVSRTEILSGARETVDDTEKVSAEAVFPVRTVILPAPAFPKSVVKTTRGTVIAEYYYDPEVYKNRRHYIYNSDFLKERLSMLVKSLKQSYNQELFATALQMMQDAVKRIDGSPTLHFEVSTNEILNSKTLSDAFYAIRTRHFDEVLSLCGRLDAKITALGANYTEMLKEQMQRLID